ncbi:bifunctional phosphopantothenoylcysteine decarboxylase/phosphopantothenate--cysteine ligase CoaBC [Aliiglaciecola sp. CAU 1673]|uniref:bifunctional phosphopantothenoylcysteine decarboxylase/phosphopantothenate--cysteine ligase CoaBC n=1 Tax=Aliiglaciecola sp. CAU 1673 TaxID=3032595 RepID=UPI0023DC0F3F|nr:bifunctional phosphopantothenoylcysteine decarboxylase/phosphopantothenate--cysteine ligase CoaBC [Aliiglaciecola sp. CAU 1673]MDF2179288.1 bifunctional phosphopantothenoylcysteine decarboxylase/phosphopantothenate--cysteine ligase CoaBC [Aliiglaciecola sp. CAU 1673]
MSLLINKNILLGISGGIAAYKTPDLVRKLKAKGANVRVVLTPSAKEFVSPLALQAVSSLPVSMEMLDPAAEAAMGHIELAKWADMILIAPASANIIARLTAGMADDLLTTLCLASDAPLFIAPAMNQQMYRAAVTQQNLATLRSRGVTCFGPAQGEQACGDVGPGRMLEPMELADLMEQQCQPALLQGLKLMITAGPTREAIDPVRYLSNHSSGKMGYALARAAALMGAEVNLVSGPVNLPAPSGCTLLKADSALQMHDQVMAKIQEMDIFIGCAAVADYRPAQVTTQKIKKSNDELTLTLIKNPDILADVAASSKPPFTVGFAAETQDVGQYAKDKMVRKRLNMIAANDVSKQNSGFNSELNALSVYWPGGEQHLPLCDKLTLATQLLTLIAQRYKEQQDA